MTAEPDVVEGEGAEGELGDEDGSGFVEAGGNGGVGGGDAVLEWLGAIGGGDVGGVEEVFRAPWNAVEGASVVAGGYFGIGGFGSDDKVRSNLVDAARRKVSKKFDIQFDRSSTILIGDTLLDVKAAHDGDAKILAVATGVHSATELTAAGADVVLASLADLDHFLAALVDLRTG